MQLGFALAGVLCCLLAIGTTIAARKSGNAKLNSGAMMFICIGLMLTTLSTTFR